MGDICWIIAVIAAVISTVLGFFATRRTKKRLSGALGREATDHDLSSINAWMKLDESKKSDASKSKERGGEGGL